MLEVTKGFAWSFIERFSVQGIGFLLGVLIARIVSPESYGLIVMIQVFISLSQVFVDGGFANALIQKKDRTEQDYYTAFIFNIGVAILFYLLLFIAAPFIADFYNEPLLTIITRVVGLNLFLSSLSIVQKVRLTVALNFKSQAKASIVAVVISGSVGLVCAYNGLEVWALVVQSLLSQMILSLFLMYISRWYPKFRFSMKAFKQLFGFGSKLLLNNLLTGIYLNICNVFIGKWYSPAQLAYYNRAFTLTQYFSVNIESILQRIIYPVTCSLQDDREALKTAYYKYLHLSNYIIIPVLMLVLVLAAPLISVLLSDKWLPAVPYIQIYCITFMMFPWADQSYSIMLAVGCSGEMLKAGIIKRIFSMIIILFSLPLGVTAICIAITIGTFIELSVSLWYCKKIIGYDITEQIKKNANIFGVSVFMGLIVFCFTLIVSNVYIQLFAGGLLGLFVYIVITMLLGMDETCYLKQIINKKINYEKENTDNMYPNL